MNHFSKYLKGYLGAGSVPFATELAGYLTTLIVYASGSLPQDVIAAIQGILTIVITGFVIAAVPNHVRNGADGKEEQWTSTK